METKDVIATAIQSKATTCYRVGSELNSEITKISHAVCQLAGRETATTEELLPRTGAKDLEKINGENQDELNGKCNDSKTSQRSF